MNPAWLCNGELLINPSMTLEGSLFSYPQVKYLRLVSRVPKKVPDSYLSEKVADKVVKAKWFS